MNDSGKYRPLILGVLLFATGLVLRRTQVLVCVHETCHWLVATATGSSAEWHWTYTVVRDYSSRTAQFLVIYAGFSGEFTIWWFSCLLLLHRRRLAGSCFFLGAMFDVFIGAPGSPDFVIGADEFFHGSLVPIHILWFLVPGAGLTAAALLAGASIGLECGYRKAEELLKRIFHRG